MLIKILGEIAKNQDSSQSSLAKALNINPAMVKQAFYDLERMGYIINYDQNCDDEACDECGLCCTKKNKGKEVKVNTGITRWKLTEKGKIAICSVEGYS